MGFHSLWVPPWGLAQGCKSLWGNKIMIQHIGVGKTSVTGHHWPPENLVSFCYRLSSPEAEAERVFGVPDIFRDQHLPRERGRRSQTEMQAWQRLGNPWGVKHWPPEWSSLGRKGTLVGFLEAKASPKGVNWRPSAGSPPTVGQGFFGGDLHSISLSLPHFHCVVCNSAMGEMWCPERKYLGLWIQMFVEWGNRSDEDFCSTISPLPSLK